MFKSNNKYISKKMCVYLNQIISMLKKENISMFKLNKYGCTGITKCILVYTFSRIQKHSKR